MSERTNERTKERTKERTSGRFFGSCSVHYPTFSRGNDKEKCTDCLSIAKTIRFRVSNIIHL
jgi:hypothetical protein